MLGTSLAVAAAAFAGVGGALLAAGATGRHTAELWRLWRFEVLLVGWIGVPAALGFPVWGLMLGLTAAACAFELASARRAPRWWALSAAGLCGLVVAAASVDPRLGLAGLALGLLGRPRDGLAIAGFPGLGLVALAAMPRLGNPFGDAIFLFGVVELHDAAASVGGQLVGRTPLARQISPRKTREGAAIALVVAVLAGIGLSPLLPELGRIGGAGAGLVLGAGALGIDLATSAWKRGRGLKDFGSTLPLHGSVLDTFDSFLGLAPLWAIGLAIARLA